MTVLPKTSSPDSARHPSGTRMTRPVSGSTWSEPAATWIFGDRVRTPGAYVADETTTVTTAATTARTATSATTRMVRLRPADGFCPDVIRPA